MIKKMILIPTLALSVSFSAGAFAKNYDKCPCPKDKMHTMEKMADKLNLTADQKEKIKDIKKQAMGDMKNYHDQMKSLNDQVKEIVKSENIDQEKLNDVINQKKELMANKMKTKIMMKNKMYNVLNAQQKTQFVEMMDKWQQEKMKKWEKMRNMNNNMSDDDMDDND